MHSEKKKSRVRYEKGYQIFLLWKCEIYSNCSTSQSGLWYLFFNLSRLKRIWTFELPYLLLSTHIWYFIHNMSWLKRMRNMRWFFKFTKDLDNFKWDFKLKSVDSIYLKLFLCNGVSISQSTRRFNLIQLTHFIMKWIMPTRMQTLSLYLNKSLFYKITNLSILFNSR